jgi:hypothetical protein
MTIAPLEGAVFVDVLQCNIRPLVIASEAKQSTHPLAEVWIASSLRSSQ